MNNKVVEAWSNHDLLKKVSPVLLWTQAVGVGITIIATALRSYIDFFWVPIIFGAIALISFAVRYYVDRQSGRLSALGHSTLVENVSKERLEGDTQLQLQIAPIRVAFEPRRITHTQRDAILSILLNKENISPKPRIKLILPPNDPEARQFANELAKVLVDGGYRKNDDQLNQAKAGQQPNPDDPGSRRLPHLFGVFSSEDGSVPEATLPGHFGSIKIFHATPLSIAKGDTSHPQAFRYTDNINDILYGISEVLQHSGFRVGRISGYGILQKGQIGFYIPSQLD